MKNFVKIVVAAIVGFNAMCVAIMCDASDKVCVAGYVVVALFVAMAFGVFDYNERADIRTMRKDSKRNLRDAA